jgi:hypothetical protein
MTKPLVASWADSWVLREAPACSTDTAAGAIRLPLCHAYFAGLRVSPQWRGEQGVGMAA